MKGDIRILFVSPCMGGYGGLEAFTLAIAEGVAAEAGMFATVLFKKAGAFVLGDDLAGKIRDAKVPVKFCDKGSIDLLYEIRTADVVHLQNPCPDVTFLAKLFGKPLLTQVINHRTNGNSLHQRLWQLCLSLADRRLYISDFVKSTWDPLQRLGHNYVVYPICKLADRPGPISERHGFAFIGRWIENKGVETLLKAYHISGLDPHEWPLQLAGTGPLKDTVTSYIAREDVKGVHILGFVSEQTKAQLIRSARFMVIPPNTNEDFGLTAIEARNLGVPCIITRDGGLPEAAGQFVISCEPGNIDDLARALKTAAEMTSADYKQMADNTYESLQRELASPEHYATHYRSILADRAGHAGPFQAISKRN